MGHLSAWFPNILQPIASVLRHLFLELYKSWLGQWWVKLGEGIVGKEPNKKRYLGEASVMVEVGMGSHRKGMKREAHHPSVPI